MDTSTLRDSESLREYFDRLGAEATERERERRRRQEERPAGQERWYLTHIGVRSDDQAINRLIRCEFEFYRPMLRKMAPIPRKRLSRKQRDNPFRPHVPKLVPLLGKYLFVRFDLRRPDWSEVFEQGGIWGIQAFKDAVRPMPAPIDDAVIDGIRAREIDGAIPGETPVRQFAYDIGEIVRVSDPTSAWHGLELPIDDLIPRELLSKKELADIDEDDGVRLTWLAFGRSNRVLLPLSAISKL